MTYPTRGRFASRFVRHVVQRVQSSQRVWWPAVWMGILLMAGPCEAQAATNSNRLDVTLQATVAETLTLAVATPSYAFGVVAPGANNAAPAGQTLAITTSWLLSTGRSVKLYAYFDSATSALSGTLLGDPIPTSAVSAVVNGGASQTFTQTSPFTTGATATLVYSVPITLANALLNNRADTMTLALNLTGVTLRPDTYTGTMHLQAQAL